VIITGRIRKASVKDPATDFPHPLS